MRLVLNALVTISLCGCAAPRQDVLLHETRIVEPATIAALLARPIDSDTTHETIPLDESREFSTALLRMRSVQERHVHRRHDVTYFVHRGTGELFIDRRRRRAKPGDFFHIPRGTPHRWVARADEDLILIRVVTPPHLGSDTLAYPAGDHSYERDAPIEPAR